ERMYKFPTEAELAYYKQKGTNWGTTDDHKTFSGYGVPSVLLIDFARRVPPQKPGEQAKVDERYMQWWHTPDDDLSQTSPASLAFAGNLVMQAFPDLETFCLPHK
ncbi:MAG: M28 family peptidase, partial [Planctomycetota bacterium]